MRDTGPKRGTKAQNGEAKGRECQKPEDKRVWRARARRAKRARRTKRARGPEERRPEDPRRPAGQKKRGMPEVPEDEQEKNPVKQLATASLSVTENQISKPKQGGKFSKCYHRILHLPVPVARANVQSMTAQKVSETPPARKGGLIQPRDRR